MLAALALAQGSADGDGEASTQLHTDGAAADGAAGRAQGAKRAWPKVHAIGEAAAAIRELPAEALKREVERRLDTLLIEAGGESLLPLLPPSRGSSAVPSPIMSSRRRKTQELSAASHGLLGGATPSGGGGGGGVSTTAAAGATTEVEEPPPPQTTMTPPPPTTTTTQSGAALHLQQQLRSGEIGDETLQATCDLVPSELRISLERLGLKRRISSGAAGVAYLASLEGAIGAGGAGGAEGGGAVTGGDVVVKFAHGSHGINDWQREVLALARLRHPNVVRCVGVVVEPPSFGTVLEYCSGGDLSTALEAPTPPGFLHRVGLDVAAGMAHLHEQTILHRDLKGANVLLTAGGVAKVTDFGLAVAAPEDTKAGGSLTAETGTYRYMAPEVICHERYSKKADIFSFGCLLFELLTHQTPFADRVALQAAVAVGLNDQRPPLPQRTPTPLRELIDACWVREAAERPSFRHVHAQLVALPAALDAAQTAWLDEPAGHPVFDVLASDRLGGETPPASPQTPMLAPPPKPPPPASGSSASGWLSRLSQTVSTLASPRTTMASRR